MTFTIPPVAPLKSESINPGQGPGPIRPSLTPTVQPADIGGEFAQAISNALDTISGLEYEVTAASQQAATGDLNSVSDYMIATSEAQLATEVTVAIRDRAIAAFNDIMRMQL
ncbi:MAG: flagellar hook-basal body complex protein FliE [Acidimicrobiales bacterium]